MQNQSPRSNGYLWNGSAWVPAPGDATNGMDVDVTRLPSLPAGANAIGSVSVSNFPATQPVSGTVTANAGTGPFPVSDNAGSLTVDAPVATPVFVRLSDGTAAIATLPVSGPLTDAQLRASAVPTTGPLTDTQLRASAVPVSGTFFQATQPVSAASLPLPSGAATDRTTAAAPSAARLSDGTAFYDARQVRALTSADVVSMIDPDAVTSGTITATDAVVAAPAGDGTLRSGASTAGSIVALACPGGDSAWFVQITGLTSGTLWFEESADSTNGTDGSWVAVLGRQTGITQTVLGLNATANGIYRGNTAGAKWMRVRSVGALSGTPAITIRISGGPGAMFLNASIPAGTNEVGRVQISDGTDVATVLPIRTQPATTEKALITNEMPSRIPVYGFTTGEIAAAITVGVKELCTVFSPAAVTQDIFIVEITVSTIVTTASTAGRSTVRVAKTAAVGVGGTNLAVADLSGAGADPVTTNAAANVMQAKTSGAADGTVFIRREWEHATQPLGRQTETIFAASNPGSGLLLRGGIADGINVSLERVVAHTALVDQTTVSIRYLAL